MLKSNPKSVGFFNLGTYLVASSKANKGYKLNPTYSKKSCVNIDKMLKLHE
jgi:hypothetical protein